MIEVVDEHGGRIEFDCPATVESIMTNRAILEGRTYPTLPFLGSVRTVLDVGANCGAASVHFARSYPEATIHAFEPGREAGGYLARNVAGLPQVVVHPFGLGEGDRQATLHLDPDDLGRSSLVRAVGDDAPSEPVEIRDAGGWAAEQGITTVDVLKVDVEGCEVEVLRSLGPLVLGAAAIHVEYDHRSARRAIEELLAGTHELYFAMLLALDQGECLYVRRDLVEGTDAPGLLKEIFAVVTR